MTNEQKRSPIFCLDKLKKHLYNTIWGIKPLLMIGLRRAGGKPTRCSAVPTPLLFRTSLRYGREDPMKGATWSRTFFSSSAKWCDTSASHFVSRRRLWLLKMDYTSFPPKCLKVSQCVSKCLKVSQSVSMCCGEGQTQEQACIVT